MLVLSSPCPTWDSLQNLLLDLPSEGLVLLTLPPGEPPQEAQNWLSSDESAAARAYARPLLSHHYLWRRVMLRVILGQVLDRGPAEVELTLGSLGKPENEDLSFNLSFSGPWVGYIWGPRGTLLGIDLEVVGNRKVDRLRAVAQRFFAPLEQEWLNEQEDHGGREAWIAGFYTLWCRKESLVKAAGVSIGSHADICPVLGSGGSEDKIEVQWEGREWEICDLEVPGLFGAKASQV